MHGVAVDSYCEQYSHKYRIHFVKRFSLTFIYIPDVAYN